MAALTATAQVTAVQARRTNRTPLPAQSTAWPLASSGISGSRSSSGSGRSISGTWQRVQRGRAADGGSGGWQRQLAAAIGGNTESSGGSGGSSEQQPAGQAEAIQLLPALKAALYAYGKVVWPLPLLSACFQYLPATARAVLVVPMLPLTGIALAVSLWRGGGPLLAAWRQAQAAIGEQFESTGIKDGYSRLPLSSRVRKAYDIKYSKDPAQLPVDLASEQVLFAFVGRQLSLYFGFQLSCLPPLVTYFAAHSAGLIVPLVLGEGPKAFIRLVLETLIRLSFAEVGYMVYRLLSHDCLAAYQQLRDGSISSGSCSG